MLPKLKFQFLWVTLLMFGLVNLKIPNFSGDLGVLATSDKAEAKSSGGSSSSSSRSSSSSSSRSSSSSSSSRSSSPPTSTPTRSSPPPSSPSRPTSAPSSNRGDTGGRAGGGSFQQPVRSPIPESRPIPNRVYSQPTYRNQPYPQPAGNTAIPSVAGTATPPPTYPNVPSQTTYPQTAPGSLTSPPQQPTNVSYSAVTDSDDQFFENLFEFFLLILAVGCVGFWTYYFILKRRKGGVSTAELDNNIVTVTKLQVALLAQARSIQSQLTEVSLNVDTGTKEGLLQLLQESALALLRSPENWSHVLATSQTVPNREAAETLFSKLSFQERSKFSAETLTNVNGQIRQQAANFHPDTQPAAYIVVTLLIGTADDKPLFQEIRTAEALKAALEQVATIRPDYLMVFELLWSPQAETDTLTYDGLLTEYTDMVQIA